MGDGENTKISQLVEHFMAKVALCTDDQDWQESDGWVGKWTIGSTGLVYKIQAGKFIKLDGANPQQTFTGEVEMSEDTFLDLMTAAFGGKGDEVFARKYGRGAIRYKGQQWIVDSERFRKVLKRLSHVPIKAIP